MAEMNATDWAYVDSSRRALLEYVPVSAYRILDIGCGAGGFGAALKEARGVEVYGIEISPVAAGIASGRLDRVYCSNIEREALEFSGAPFDCVTFMDMLERFENPWVSSREFTIAFVRKAGASCVSETCATGQSSSPVLPHRG